MCDERRPEVDRDEVLCGGQSERGVLVVISTKPKILDFIH